MSTHTQKLNSHMTPTGSKDAVVNTEHFDAELRTNNRPTEAINRCSHKTRAKQVLSLTHIHYLSLSLTPTHTHRWHIQIKAYRQNIYQMLTNFLVSCKMTDSWELVVFFLTFNTKVFQFKLDPCCCITPVTTMFSSFERFMTGDPTKICSSIFSCQTLEPHLYLIHFKEGDAVIVAILHCVV